MIGCASGSAATSEPPPPSAPSVSSPSPSVSPSPPRSTAAPASPAQPPGPQVCIDLVDGRAIRRAALTRALDAGLGFWLRGVEVTPHREAGRFAGWRVRKIYSGDPCFALVDVRPGDVVLRINRRSIERPEEAHELWESLRSAPAVTVDLVRDKKPRSLTLPIVE